MEEVYTFQSRLTITPSVRQHTTSSVLEQNTDTLELHWSQIYTFTDVAIVASITIISISINTSTTALRVMLLVTFFVHTGLCPNGNNVKILL